MLFLSADDCRRLLDTATVLEVVEDALRMDGEGTVRWSEPRSMRVGGGESGSRLRVKAGALGEPGVAGVRVLAFSPAHGDTRWVLVLDDTTGEPRAIVDEAWTYPRRSIASVALLAHRLSPPDVARIGLLGAGRIARAALPYIRRLFPGAALSVTSRREETRGRLAELARDRVGIDAVAVPVEQAVRGSQVVLACTSASSAVLREGWVEPGTVVGSLETTECGLEFYEAADFRIVDSREQLEDELIEAYGTSAPARVDASMAEVVTGVHPGRTHEAQRILVLSQGLVSQDLLLAARAWKEAVDRGIGTAVPIESPSPYG
jgi:ornithine cyclodeaminase/alanine dehydrogenase-like protein (mu-crystallin family)